MLLRLLILVIFFLIISCSKKKEEIRVDKIEENKKTEYVNTEQEQKDEYISLTSKEAQNHINKFAKVSGYIADVVIREKVAYLNFDDRYPKNTFTGVIFKDDFHLFDDLMKFKSKNVELSGKITIYSGKAQIIIKSPEQIRIIK